MHRGFVRRFGQARQARALAANSGNCANVFATIGQGMSAPHSVLPMRRGSTHRTRPPRAFLSPATMGRSCDAVIFPSGGSGPTLAINFKMRLASLSGRRSVATANKSQQSSPSQSLRHAGSAYSQWPLQARGPTYDRNSESGAGRSRARLPSPRKL